MENGKSIWGHCTFCVITGASRGIGKNFAIEFAQKFAPKSVILLLARSESGLEETKKYIVEKCPDVFVEYQSVDLANPNPQNYSNILKTSFNKYNAEPSLFTLSMIVHNAGSVGDVSQKTAEMRSSEKWQEYLSFNLISAICLNTEFLKITPSSIDCLVINVTSKCAILPFKSMGYYCVGKASREMYFKVLAEENPTLRVLNYSPGPVKTDMVVEVINNVQDSDTKDMFISLVENDTILSLEQTTKRIIQLLDEGKFASGQRVDYYDDI